MRTSRTGAIAAMLAAALIAALAAAPAPAADPPAPAWEKAVAGAARKPPMTAAEAEAFVAKLHDYARANHLKADPNSAQKGMLYEYFDTTRKGKFDQWVQGEALDTMHDGAWYAMAMAHAHRATGARRYRDFLKEYQLPFYTKVLNHSDALFNAKQMDVAEKGVRFNKEHALQPGEKGFCPYWWDDGASVSLERRRLKDPFAKPPFACTDLFAGKPNPEAKLAGYSHGSSNHLAQDLGPMLLLGWLTFRDSADPAGKKLAAECAEAAKNLQACRTRHGFGAIPAVVSAAGATNGDKELLKRVGEPKLAVPSNHYTRFLLAEKPDQRHSTPGFMDDAEYSYYSHLANGAIPPAVRFKLVYDCYTEPMLFRYWSDDADVPPGLNRFDLIGQYGKGGKFESYRSQRPVALGSRFGPQNMAVSAWALQMLDAQPGLWDDAVKQLFPKDVRVGFVPEVALDGKPDAGAGEELQVGAAKLRLVSTRTALVAWGTFEGEALELTLAGPPDRKGGKAVVSLGAGGVAATNAAGEKLRVGGVARPVPNGPLVFEFALPYTVVKDQKPWANGVELGRYAVSVGKESKTFVLASSEKQVREALERELAGGLRTWEAIFEAKGFIPTALGAGGDWDKFSDTGGYAHLISAASQYVLRKQKKRDWEPHK
jgi:hypothetical protein